MVLIGWIRAVSGDDRIIKPFTASLAWRGGKENPHRPYADGGNLEGVWERVSSSTHSTCSLMQARCQ
jgi:hypothetical protein